MANGDLIRALTGRGSNALDRRQRLAEMLIGQSQQVQNPLVAALTGFAGGLTAQQTAQEQGLLDEQARIAAQEQAEFEREGALFERDIANKKLGMLQQELGIKSEEAAKRLQKLDAEINKLNKEAAQKQEMGFSFDPEKTVKIEGNLRKEFTDLSKDFLKQRDAFGRITASASDPSAAGDLALIFNYMKVLDPGSTVREGEFANAENSAGVPSRLRALYNKVTEGQRLTAEQRGDFVGRAGKLFNAANSQHQQRVNVFSNLASKSGVRPDSVVIDLGITEENLIQEEPVPPSVEKVIETPSFEGFKILNVK